MRVEILLSLGAAFALLALVGGVAWFSTRQISSHLDEVAQGSLASTAALGDINEGKNRVARVNHTLMLRTKDFIVRGEIRQDLADLDSAWARLDAGSTKFAALEHGPETLKTWEEATKVIAVWRDASRKLADVARIGDQLVMAGKDPGSPEVVQAEATAWAAWTEARQRLFDLEGALEALLLKVRTDADASVDAANRAAARASATSALVIAFGLVALVLFAVHSARRLARTIRAVVGETERLRQAAAAGDLDARGDPSHIDPEFRPIVLGFNDTMSAYLKPISRMFEAVTRLGDGEIPEAITDRWEGGFGRIKDAVNRCTDSVGALVEDARGLSAAATQGDFEKRADGTRHRGRFREVVEGVNLTLGVVVQRMFWYEQILDAIPLPVLVMDRDLRLLFTNRVAEARLGKHRQALHGKPCEATGLPLCGTEQCVVRRLGRGESVTPCRHGDSDLRVAGAYLRDAGGAVVGYVEVTQDVTALVRLSEYQRSEIDRISSNLVRLASGQLSIDDEIGAGNEHTAEARQLFLSAAASMERLRAAIAALVEDVNTLVGAAAAGKLTVRADPARHEGEFRAVVAGIDRTLDDVVAPVVQAASTLERLAGRDLRVRVQGQFQGDHALMQRAVNGTAEALHTALLRVATAADQVSSAAEQIAASSQSVAAGTTEQAASLQETTASIGLVQTKAQQNAADAARANGLAVAARDAALAGSTSVGQLQAAMDRIRESATSTSQIIKDVSEIAFQTNLLALNAAVEAARAGEAGRGFAVVAEEVRSLALRAKEAAVKTEQLIEGSVRHVGEGATMATRVAGGLTEIATMVRDVTRIVAQIADASKEEVEGIARVSRAVAEMDRVTQQNAASAEESSAAANEMSGQAAELAGMVNGFHLDRTGRQEARFGAPTLLPPAPVSRRPRP